MQLSVSCAPRTAPIYCHTQFSKVTTATAGDLARIIINEVWSPIIWEDGRRLGSLFQRAEALVLDFDDGVWDLAFTCRWLKTRGYKHVVGTTKSHGIAKGSMPPCDRFRVIIPWHKPITSREHYEQNCARVLFLTPADKACKDAGRMYQPCTKIVSASGGRPVTVARINPRRAYPPSLLAVTGILPTWAENMLRTGVPPGRRNASVFKLAATMTRGGWKPSDIEARIIKSAIDLPEREILSAINSGIKRAGER